MNIKEIQDCLFEMADLKYKEFHSGLVPNVNKDKFIGVRVPALRKLAKGLVKDSKNNNDIEAFLQQLPHDFYEENQLHSFLIDYLDDDFWKCWERVEAFLPEIDNWAVCDSFKPRGLKKQPKALYAKLAEILKSNEAYAVRWAIVVQISWFLGDLFEPVMAENVAKVACNWISEGEKAPEKDSPRYYVLMAVAWYFSMAMVSQREAVIEFFQDGRLPIWVHNKSLQKVVESKQFSGGEKEELKKLKV